MQVENISTFLMKKYIPLLLLFVFFASCASKKDVANTSTIDTTKRVSFNKVMKSSDYPFKLKMAKEYYNNEKYVKAIDLMEQLVPRYKGLPEGQEIYFLYCMSNMKIGDYLYAGYHFKSFYDLYPVGDYSEQALFLSAYCNYLETPRWSLDQQPTRNAIDQFQLFVSEYERSSLIDSTNSLVDTMRFTLEKKAFMNGKLYYDLGYYNAADITLNNTINEYPDSPFNEDALYYIIKANIKYADGSVSDKQTQRYKNTISNCLRYSSKYPDGMYLKEVQKIKSNAQKNIKKNTDKNNQQTLQSL